MRGYRWLLYLFPASFRSEYGAEMCGIFARRRAATSSVIGAMALWASTIRTVLADALGAHWDIVRQDLRYSARSLSHSPGFSFTAIIVVAIGIGANTAIFSVTDHILFRPLPFADSERLVTLWERLPDYGRTDLSPANYRDWKRMTSSFESIGAFRGLSANLVGQSEPQRIDGASVTFELLPMLGVQPFEGRLFDEHDDREDSGGTLLLSYRLWQDVFGGDSGVVGRTVRLDGTPYVVIGIMPAGFYFPSRDAQLWTAVRFAPQDFADRNNNFLHVVGKLKRTVSLQEAQTEMRLIASQLERQYPKENENVSANLFSLRDEVSNQSRLLLLALFGTALGVLLIACTNLANLLLSRALNRQKEVAVRAALGAPRERLMRQLLTESLVLAAVGGALGICLAMFTLPLMERLTPASLPVAALPSLNLRVLTFCVLLTGLTGLAFGAVPALHVCRKSDLSGLREGSRSGVGGRKEAFRSALIIAQVSISVVLLVTSGLLLRALFRLQMTDPGFRSDNVITLRTVLPMPRYEKTASRTMVYARVLDEIRALPEVAGAAYTSFLPLVMRGGVWSFDIDGRQWKSGEQHVAGARFVTPGFIDVMGIPLRSGRDVAESDTMNSPCAAVVSESFARRYWPNQDSLGRRFRIGASERIIVGVVGDIRVRGLESVSEPQVYLPYKQVPDGAMTWWAPKDLVIQTSAGQAAIVPLIRRIIRNVDSELPISDVRSLSDIVSAETAPRRVQVRVLGTFAGVAFLLAGIGLHGLLSFTVSQRSNEFGVRIALGAKPTDILRLMLRQCMRLTGIGILFGIVLAYVAGWSLQSLLAGVAPSDAVTFIAAISLSMVMTILGSLMPALRAIRVDPIRAIHAHD